MPRRSRTASVAGFAEAGLGLHFVGERGHLATGEEPAAAADLDSRGAWTRLRICKDPSCRRGFFDKTRNSSGLYCSSACSSKMAMRAYRSRQKTG